MAKQLITILKSINKFKYKVEFEDNTIKEMVAGVKLTDKLIENNVYEVEINKNYINSAKLVRTLEKVPQNEYEELIDLIKEKEEQVQLLDKKSLSYLFCNANYVASTLFQNREWDYELFERVSNEVYLANLNRFLRVNKRY